MSTEDIDVATGTIDFVRDTALAELVRPLDDVIGGLEVAFAVELDAKVKKDAGDGSGDGETDADVTAEILPVPDTTDDIVEVEVMDDVTEVGTIVVDVEVV